MGVTVAAVVALIFFRVATSVVRLVVALRLVAGVHFGLVGGVFGLVGDALVDVALVFDGDGFALGYARAFLLVRFGGMVRSDECCLSAYESIL